jgi:hypothetical protein
LLILFAFDLPSCSVVRIHSMHGVESTGNPEGELLMFRHPQIWSFEEGDKGRIRAVEHWSMWSLVRSRRGYLNVGRVRHSEMLSFIGFEIRAVEHWSN